MRTHAIAGKWLSLLSPESRMHACEADIAKKHHWNCVTEAARFERGRSCGFIATLSRFARNSRACLAALRFQLRLQDQGGPSMIRPFAACGSPLASPLGGQRVHRTLCLCRLSPALAAFVHPAHQSPEGGKRNRHWDIRYSICSAARYYFLVAYCKLSVSEVNLEPSGEESES
jgi:hypothetical protein